MSDKAIKNIVYVIKGGLFILPFLSLIVIESLFFPFITGKNFFFRMVVEAVFFLWIFVAVFDKKYRPGKSHILISLTLLIFILSLATFFGENPSRSFWSNYERMEGLIGHLHLFAYFLVLTSVFKSKKDWKIFFAIMILVSAAVAVYAFLQFQGIVSINQGSARLDATFGNATYLAIFMVFHMFLIGLFFYWYKNKWMRTGLAALFLVEVLVMFFTATRGAILGFIGGLFLYGVFMAFLSKNKKVRYVFFGVIAGLVLLVAIFMLVKDSSFVQNNYVFSRFANISFSERTTESRLTIWGMSWKGFQEHPLLGWGPENYNLVFNKYYEPKLWKQEPWFDRSHNIVFDWLISAGALGFLAYLSIFVGALYIVWSGFKKGKFSLFEAAGLTSLLAAYSFHNLFVFDNITSYFAFFSILGYIHFKHVPENAEKRNEKEIGMLGYLAVTFSFILVIFSLYFANIKPLVASNDLLGALYNMRVTPDVNVILKKFDDVFSLNTFGTGEAREQLVGYADGVYLAQGITEENKLKVINKAIVEMEKQAKENPGDIRYLVMLSAVYTKINMLDKALETINEAIALSPNKQQLYFVKADIFLAVEQFKESVEVMEIAYNLDKTYTEAAQVLGALYVFNGQMEKSEEVLGTHFGKPLIADERLASAYYKAGNLDKVKEIWLMFIETNPNNVQYHLRLAATYSEMGQKDNAILELQKIIEIDPSLKKEAEAYIEQIKAGTL